MDLQQFSELVGLIYNVGLDTDGWEQALAGLAVFFGCAAAAMRIVDMDDFHVVFEVPSNAGDAAMDAFARHFAGVLPQLDMLKTASNHYAGDVFVVGDGEAVRLEHAEALIARLQKGRGIKGFVINAGNRIMHIAMQCDGRALDRRLFSEALPLLVPHLQRAYLACRRLLAHKYRTDGIEQAMNCFNSGVVLLDGSGTAVYMNRRAREIMARMQGLHVVSGQLAARTAQLTHRLRQMIATAVEMGKQGDRRIETMAIQSGDEESIALALAAVPLPADRQVVAPDHTDIHAAMLIASPAFICDQKPEVLQLFANLTNAEARLALALAAGRTLRQYCRDSGIQISTARGYLKQVFVKTGTNRQSELVSLVHSFSFHL